MNLKRVFKFILSKAVKLLSLLFAVSVISFTLVAISPIDPIQSYVGADITRVSPEQREEIAEYWGLNESRILQFMNWGSAVIQGDLGTSLIYRAPVIDIILERFLASLGLMGLAWLLSGVIGFLLGVVAAVKQGTIIDRFIKTYCYTLASTPTFWLGLLLLTVFSVWLGWFPIGLGTPAGVLAEDVFILDKFKHLLLPVLTLSIIGVSNIALHTREKLVEVLQSEYILYAKAKGKKGYQLAYQHGLRNIALPAISIHFSSFGEIFGGSVIAEQVFSYPGLGQAVVQAGLGGDVPLLLGIVLFSSVFVFIGNLLADILYKVIDPRIRKGDLH
ncbi:ABC transporter permease [Oceanobacillus caeni]|uniref:ABC transporter permease n=1 Tax=Oceanobacillus caeni TaxID=405946 RepID=A0ABR5MMA7_9BACI|nr:MULTISPECIES: ABC transporter permease [Bacillaceae]KKE79494.1 ABC transporter permease [Bacilli bacterium VT-13-104]PZD83684.1 ABC transporter permease [Bacilli bacterium]KPH77605.1 ABC transporter permease [Oceanobacillus caeni]MBU8791946.1 ABC transporter permease [Oceanobacillus caeni]MCR1836003.1 ABC transporter permease [Oceanobacillus caeni]